MVIKEIIELTRPSERPQIDRLLTPILDGLVHLFRHLILLERMVDLENGLFILKYACRFASCKKTLTGWSSPNDPVSWQTGEWDAFLKYDDS